jgi:hypothetical protein
MTAGKFLILVSLPFFLASCSSNNIEGTVIASNDIGQGITESLVETGKEQLPYFKVRTNTNNFKLGSKVIVEVPESAP